MKTRVMLITTLALLSPPLSASFADETTEAKTSPVIIKEVNDIIGFGGKINVKNSKAEVLGGAAGDVETENSSFETVILAAGTITMKGGSVDELKLAAGKIDLDINVTGDGDLAGGQVSLAERMSVKGDLEILAGSVDLNGTYGGDVTIEAESVKVAGKIGGDLTISGRRVSIAPGTIIGGNLKVPSETEIAEGVTVGGERKIGKAKKISGDRPKIAIDLDDSTQEKVKARIDEATAKVDEARAKLDEVTAAAEKLHGNVDQKDDDAGLISPQPMGMGAWLTVLVTLAICGTLALGIAPQFVVKATERLALEPLPSLGVGLLSVVAVPAALIAVGITIIGIPFALLGAAAYMIGLGLGLIALCLWGGLMVRTLANQPGQETRVPKLVGWTLMGFLALALIGAIPVVGRIIQILAIMTGAGAVLATAWALRRKSEPVTAS